jgi:hypothetical protein
MPGQLRLDPEHHSVCRAYSRFSGKHPQDSFRANGSAFLSPALASALLATIYEPRLRWNYELHVAIWPSGSTVDVWPPSMRHSSIVVLWPASRTVTYLHEGHRGMGEITASPPDYKKLYYKLREKRSTRAADLVLPLLFDHLHIKSVIDVGCGTGTWLTCG